MNYQKIYNDFIADRLAKEPDCYRGLGYNVRNQRTPRVVDGVSYEHHHILPRRFGGSDKASNIISLSVEDHIWSHILLAKIHGGTMWNALSLTVHGKVLHKKERVTRLERKAAALARENLTGEGNNKFNATEFDWVNYDSGKKERATLYAMHKKYGGSRSSWTNVVNDDKKPSVFGWYVAKNGVRTRSAKGKVFDFVNRDGRTFTGTQQEWVNYTGSNAASASRVCKNKSVTLDGWRLKGVDDRNSNSPKSGGRPGVKPKTIILKKGDTTIEGSRIEIAKILGSTPGAVSAGVYEIKAGNMSTYKGWQLVSMQ